MVMLRESGGERKIKEEETEIKEAGINKKQIIQTKHFKAVCQESLAKTHTHNH